MGFWDLLGLAHLIAAPLFVVAVFFIGAYVGGAAAILAAIILFAVWFAASDWLDEMDEG
jgi:hypothetical protein